MAAEKEEESGNIALELEQEEDQQIQDDDKDVEEQVEKFFAELDIDQERQKRRFLKGDMKLNRRRSNLPSHLHQVMGSANLSLARGETTAAIELCLEVIRQSPFVVEPYLTLATIYEDIGDRNKLTQILLIAATLRRSDHELWSKVADLAIEVGQLHLATECLAKCFKFNHQNLSVLWKKANIYEELEMTRKATDTYEQLYRLLSKKDQGREIVEVSKQLARNYHSSSEDLRAVSVLREARQNYGSLFDDEATNLLTELLINNKLYGEALDTILSFYKIPFTTTTTTSQAMPTPSATPTTPHEPLTLSAALSMSMHTSDIITDPISGQSAGLNPRPDTTTTKEDEIIIRDLPDTLPVDLRTKLSICLTHLHYRMPENILNPLLSDPDDCGDLILDIAEAHMENVEYSKALSLLNILVDTEGYNEAEVWLKHAECLHMLKELDQAAISYRTVLTLAPNHTETRVTLASLYSQLGMMEDALALLDDTDDNLQPHSNYDEDRVQFQPSDTPKAKSKSTNAGPTSSHYTPNLTVQLSTQVMVHDLRLTHTKFKLLVGETRTDEFVQVGTELLSFYFRHYFYRNDLIDFFGFGLKVVKSKLKNRSDQDIPMSSFVPPEEEKSMKEKEKLLTKDEWWSVFFKTCNALYVTMANPQLLMRLVMCADVAKKFEQYDKNLYLIIYQICLRLDEQKYAFHFMRALYFKIINGKTNQSNLFWALFNRIPPTNRQQKFVLRQLIKHPDYLPLLKISGNYSLIASSYKFALAQYEMAYKDDPNNYILCLSISIVYCNLSLQKHSLHRNTLVLQSIAFLHKYFHLRGPCQESYYNVGRLFHQLGLIHIACQYYERVLVTDAESSHEISENIENKRGLLPLADLRKEAAFNLSLIYRNSGSEALAIHCITRFCTV